MKNHRPKGPLWKISVTLSPEAEDAGSELLSSRFGQPATAYFDLETRLSTITVYLDQKPRWTTSARTGLQRALKQLADFGLKVGRPKISLSKVRREDWAESWKRHFRPLEIGGALLIKPSWIRRRARRGRAMIILDPGLSFGTGQHPTTRFCLEQIVAQAKLAPKSFLDIGTGSGILALAAASLGYEPILAFDFDPEAVGIAQDNARANHLDDRIRFQRQDVHRLALRPLQTYSLVCANLTADLLLECRDHILAQISPGGVLVLAGILTAEFHRVRRAYEQAGLRLLKSGKQGEWQSGTFVS